MENLESKVTTLAKQVEELKEEIKGKENAPKKSRRRIPKEISAAVKSLHDGARQKFVNKEQYNSESNVQVKNYLETHLKQKFGSTYSPKRLREGIHRYYESRRRLWNDKLPSRVSQVAKVKADGCKRRLCRKLYTDREKVLKTQQERDLWHTIDYNYQSEVSEHEEDDEIVIHCHHIPWRSERLNKLVKKLDKRLSKRKTPTKKLKVLPEYSKFPQPSNAPAWAIKQDATSTPAAFEGTSTTSGNSDSNLEDSVTSIHTTESPISSTPMQYSSISMTPTQRPFANYSGRPARLQFPTGMALRHPTNTNPPFSLLSAQTQNGTLGASVLPTQSTQMSSASLISSSLMLPNGTPRTSGYAQSTELRSITTPQDQLVTIPEGFLSDSMSSSSESDSDD